MYHCHTECSLLDSCTKYQDYVDLAVRDGSKALSISEHGKPLNWTEKWNACKKAGLRYIHSVEIYLTESLEEKVRDNYHTVLMARNMEGIRELNALVSKSCDKDHFYYTNRISFDEFLGISKNIISTSACLASPLNKLEDTHPRYMELAKKYDFLEVQAHNHPDQIAFNQRLMRLSKQIGTPLIAGTDTHSSSKYKAECRKALLDAKHKTYGDEDSFDLSYKTYDELVNMFEIQNALPKDVYLQAIENTNLLYDMTEDIELDTSIKYPILYGSREADSQMFVDTVERKFKEKLESGIIPREQEQAFRKAIDEEMRVFKKLKMDGFMLSMSDLISWCKSQKIPLGFARGSVSGSRVAYVTDITDFNSETWHTSFARFANEDRVEPGDIDTDCTESDRPKIFKYIVNKYGQEKTARVAAFGTMQARGVIDDVGRHLAHKWSEKNPESIKENPWSLSNIARIKEEFDKDPEDTKQKYKELFYYFDGLIDTKISQSVHPAGIVVSPITLSDNYGVFDKDGEECLMLDMDNVHEYAGLVKYDMLVLKTIQVISDTCKFIGIPYPKTHEINWDDQEVWADMIRSPFGIFQMESKFAFDSLKKFKPQSIFDMSLVAACIRPSGASYRDELLARKTHKNPSKLIDDLFKESFGFMPYQENTLDFLQEICGLSGSEADNVRRAIGRKQKDRLEEALPSILEGYCNKSDKSKDEAEQEAKEFLQIIQDSASYQFSRNHSISYCMLGYLCAYYRHYYPIEFITSFLNNAANEEDIRNGTAYANKIGINVTMPKWGVSKSKYSYSKEKNIITKGLASVKYMNTSVAEELYDLANGHKFNSFVDILYAISETSINTRQLDILIKLDFFAEYGNQRELLKITELYYETFKKGQAKRISKAKIQGTPLESIVAKYAVGNNGVETKTKNFILLDVNSILQESEKAILGMHLDDLSVVTKVKNFAEVMGYAGYVSGKQEDRPKLYISDVYPIKRKDTGTQFGYSILTKSIGSGIESNFTVLNSVFNKNPIKKGDVILCKLYTRNGKYFRLNAYEQIT